MYYCTPSGRLCLLQNKESLKNGPVTCAAHMVRGPRTAIMHRIHTWMEPALPSL